MIEINSIIKFQEVIAKNEFTLAYFSHDNCQVCHVLLPKVQALLMDNFPKVKMAYCNTEKTAEVAAQNRIFTVPSIIIFIHEKESYRFGRNFSISELSQVISRPYQMMFD